MVFISTARLRPKVFKKDYIPQAQAQFFMEYQELTKCSPKTFYTHKYEKLNKTVQLKTQNQKNKKNQKKSKKKIFNPKKIQQKPKIKKM